METTPSPTVWTLSGMTAETIQFREKILISTHWVISFMILSVIPVVYFMNKNAQNHKSEERNNSIPENNPQHIAVPTESSSKLQPVIKSTRAHRQCNSVSHSGSTKRKHTLDAQHKTRRIFRILTAVCLFLWWSRVVTAACSLMIWHYNYKIAVDIAFPWDTTRGLLYLTSKVLMYTIYAYRIHHSYGNSAYGYPKWFIVCLYALITVDYIIKVTADVMLNVISSGELQDKGEASDFLHGTYAFLVVEELILALLMMFAFIKPLSRLTLSIIKDSVLSLVTRYLILGTISILSTVALSVFRLLYVGSFDLMVVWMTAVWVSIDCLINAWCTVLLFSSSGPTYKLFCGRLDRTLKHAIQLAYAKRHVDEVTTDAQL
eukprot:30401_1